MLFCLLSSTCDFETHAAGKASIVKPPSCYLFTCPRDNCLETGVCTSQADLSAAYLSSLKPSKKYESKYTQADLNHAFLPVIFNM